MEIFPIHGDAERFVIHGSAAERDLVGNVALERLASYASQPPLHSLSQGEYDLAAHLATLDSEAVCTLFPVEIKCVADWLGAAATSVEDVEIQELATEVAADMRRGLIRHGVGDTEVPQLNGTADNPLTFKQMLRFLFGKPY